MKKFLLIAIWLFAVHALLAGPVYRVSFHVKIGDEITNLERFSYFVLPGDTLTLSVTGDKQNNYSIYSHDGELISPSGDHWLYVAPSQKGNYKVLIQEQASDENMLLQVFVMVPATEIRDGYLNGYRIGNYPDDNYKNKKNYQNPVGFIEVTQENKDVYLSPHFQLKQFLCKQKSDWPKYVVIKPRMLRKLELVLEELYKAGVKAKTLFLMSAYRTPYYNKSIGNVKYSRHIYGDAIDIYVDENHDAVMDDLNKDGVSSMKDADVVQKIIEIIDNNPDNKELIGGMGKYNKNAAHTYFIHIDTRGYKARW
jgi:uncharacterized protein YcbK (DUF882 family)